MNNFDFNIQQFILSGLNFRLQHIFQTLSEEKDEFIQKYQQSIKEKDHKIQELLKQNQDLKTKCLNLEREEKKGEQKVERMHLRMTEEKREWAQVRDELKRVLNFYKRSENTDNIYEIQYKYMQEIRDKYYYKDAKKRNTVVYEKENKDMNSFKERFSYNDYKNSKVVRKRIESGYNNLLGSCLRQSQINVPSYAYRNNGINESYQYYKNII